MFQLYILLLRIYAQLHVLLVGPDGAIDLNYYAQVHVKYTRDPVEAMVNEIYADLHL